MRPAQAPEKSAALEESRYRLLVEAVSDYAIYMLDANGFVRTWNPGAQRFKGYTEREILGEHFSRFYIEEDRQNGMPQRALDTALREGRFENEGWRLRKDGTRLWAHVVIDPIRDKDGNVLGFAKITRDITERKKAREALRFSEERFRLLVQGVKDHAIFMLDGDGMITNWNPGAQRVKGYTEPEILGQHFSRFYTPEDIAAGMPGQALATAANAGRFSQEGWRVRKNGERFWADVTIDAIHDEMGALIGFAKVTRDASERKRAQVALEDAQAQLFQSQKMEAIGQLTGGVAHDFNNLLAVIIGNLELARKRSGQDERLSLLIDNSIEAASRGASLTQRMLAFARKQPMTMEAIDVPELVRNIAGLLQRAIGPQADISVEFSLSLPSVQADPHQLELALLNLVVNARDAMQGRGIISMKGREAAAKGPRPRGLERGRYVILSIGDTGAGMDDETLKKAIEPFFTTKGVGKGTGLGLSMVYGFAEQSGGALTLQSAPGKGTTAELWLKVAEARPDEKVSGNDNEPAQLAPLSILVVDDDVLVCMNTTAMLEDLGHMVTEAASGVDALRHIDANEHFDLVISDQAMPGMTGLELLRLIRERRPQLPSILATGYAVTGPEASDGVLRLNKPFFQDDLVRAIAASINVS